MTTQYLFSERRYRNERLLRSALLQMQAETQTCSYTRWQGLLLIVLQEDSGIEKGGDAEVKCMECKGKGKIPFPVLSTNDDEEEVFVEVTVMINCLSCGGTGKIEKEDEE